jgi:hypothetical protein
MIFEPVSHADAGRPERLAIASGTHHEQRHVGPQRPMPSNDDVDARRQPQGRIREDLGPGEQNPDASHSCTTHDRSLAIRIPAVLPVFRQGLEQTTATSCDDRADPHVNIR